MSSKVSQRKLFEVKLQEKLEADWSDWFNGLQIESSEDFTLLKGYVTDQAALHGILTKIRDLGLTLISIEELKEYS